MPVKQTRDPAVHERRRRRMVGRIKRVEQTYDRALGHLRVAGQTNYLASAVETLLENGRIALAELGKRHRFAIVQHHPLYRYQDLMEQIRPRELAEFRELDPARYWASLEAIYVGWGIPFKPRH